jgi:hypothetical protein
MYSFLKKNHRFLFFGAWLIINLMQACTTELFDDEAYYWIYSQYPAWGYFDHPPMIAILIKGGYAFFQSELGVRLLVVLLNAATLFLISRLIDSRNDKLFYAISLTIAVGHIGGIIAVPDVPLLFFVALFFLMYGWFVKNMSWLNCLLLGISIALMLYTKYHGLLIVVFTVLSNPKLFTKYQIYLVGAISLLFFAPHIYWQYVHGFPSLQYHLVERNANSFQIEYTSEYIVTQLVLAGPVMGWLLIWTAIRYNALTPIERALRFTLIGFYFFFLISTFKGRVEANWTLPAFVALIVLSHQYLNQKPQLAAWIYKMLPLTLLLVLSVRIYMLLDVRTMTNIGKDEFHQNWEWVDVISKKANGLPVVFIDSYQRPSKYWFYEQEPALGLNTPDYRRNNFNFWPIEDSYIGKPAFIVGDDDNPVLKDRIIAPGFKNKASAVIPNYYSFMKAELLNVKNKVSSDSITSSFSVSVPEKYLEYFQNSAFDTASIQLAILNVGGPVRYSSSQVKVKQITRRFSHFTAGFPIQLPKGVYNARLGISSAIPGEPTLNSTSFRITIK